MHKMYPPKNSLPVHIMGSGLRKSPPELNAVPVSTEGGAASAVTGPSVNTGRNLDIHDASSFPVSSITAQDNISVYSSSEDDSSVFDISAKKTTSKIKGQPRSLKRQTGGAKTKKSRTAGGAVKRKKRLAAATSFVNLTGVCLETEGNGDNVLPAVDNVLPAIDEAINEMFPPLRESVADDIEVVGLARKETPLFEVEGVVAACAPFGSSDMFSDSGEDEDNHSGNKVGGAMSTNMEAQLILGRFRSKQASLTSPSLFAQTTDKGSYFSTSDEDDDEDNDFYPEEDPPEGLYDDDELFQDDKEEDLNDLSYYRSDATSSGVGRKLYRLGVARPFLMLKALFLTLT
jgi:hypothetical protein